jgi:hypothetical protein
MAAADGHAAGGGVVDAVIARHLRSFALSSFSLPLAAPALCRLLQSGVLRALSLAGGGLEDLHTAGLLSGALRADRTLTLLRGFGTEFWYEPLLATFVLGALVALEELELSDQDASGCPALAGQAIAALVAADAPTLRRLDVSGCQLGDAGLAPLCDALARNTHLRELDCSGNGMSAAFAQQRLLPAVRGNSALRKLLVADAGAPAVEELQARGGAEAAAFVAQREADRLRAAAAG